MGGCRRRAGSLTVPIQFLSDTRWKATLGIAEAAGSYAASTTGRLTAVPLTPDGTAIAALQAELQHA